LDVSGSLKAAIPQLEGMTTTGEITPEMHRVLAALCESVGQWDQDQRVPLRAIAAEALAGDTQRAARVLAALDAGGYVRTDNMGWYTGWLTAKGIQAGELRRKV
jgi:hypothetical protein